MGKRRFAMVKKILLLAVLLSIGLISVHISSASAERNCNLKQICAQPGDYLKYAAQVYGNNGTISYKFGNFTDPDTLKVSISTLVGGQTINSQSILNLKNFTLINNDGTKSTFFFMVLTPINPNEIAASPFKEGTATYNNYQRSVYGIEQSNGTDSQEVIIDKETGVLLDYKVVHAQVISGQQMVTGSSFVLVDTNIITSSDLQSTDQSQSTIVNNPTSIPNSVSNPPDSGTSNDSMIIYIGIAIAVAGAGAGIMIMRKRKHKSA